MLFDRKSLCLQSLIGRVSREQATLQKVREKSNLQGTAESQEEVLFMSLTVQAMIKFFNKTLRPAKTSLLPCALRPNLSDDETTFSNTRARALSPARMTSVLSG